MHFSTWSWSGAVLVLTAGCGSADKAGPTERLCSGNAASVSLIADPTIVPRGADLTLTIEWQTYADLDEPTATLSTVASPAIEVTVPLAHAAGSNRTYVAALANPFGVLAPAGVVHVLAEGVLADCRVGATATTALTLE